MPPIEDLQFLLGGMNAKLDTLIASTNEDRERVEKLVERIRCLEEFKSKALALAGVLSALLGAAGGTLASKVFGP